MSDPDPNWTTDTLNNMALGQLKLEFYTSAYTYYMLANNKEEAAKLFPKIKMTELEQEYKEHISPNVKIMTVKGRRGVFATKDIEIGHIICNIPLYLCEAGSKKDLTKYAAKNNIYSRSLPSDIMPSEWSPSKCDQIGVSPMRLILENRIMKLKEEGKDTDLDDYLHYRALVGGRNFSDGSVDHLVPFADMLNHSNKPNVEWSFKGDYFIMEATEKIKAHEELFDYYGPKSNYETFLYYGFVQPNNTKMDVVRVIGELPNSIGKARLDPRYFQNAFEFELRGEYMEGTVEVFSFLRYVRSGDKKCPETLKGFIKRPVNKENEIWVCKMLYNMLQQEVHRRVEETRFGVEEPLAVALLQSEMRVLVHWGEVLMEALNIMTNNNVKACKKSTNDYIVKVIKKYKYFK